MTTHCKPSRVIVWPYCCGGNGAGNEALIAFGRRILEREERRPKNAIDLTGLEVARMIGSDNSKIAGDGIAMCEGNGGILEYIAKKHPRMDVRATAVVYLLKMIRDLGGEEHVKHQELQTQNASTIINSGSEYERGEAVSSLMWIMHRVSKAPGHGQIIQASEWYSGGDYTEKPKETKGNGQDSEFVKGLAGLFGVWKFGIVLKEKTV
ncbi:TPA: hypothetical protein HA238_06515 [Candidatus Micrarchaeota archaeon]|nr:hypothetical protein [Candidatus Micrarchaeota archaeon]